MACFRFVGPFWGVFGDFGVQNRHFSSFFVVTSPLREGVEVLGITPHLLNPKVRGGAQSSDVAKQEEQDHA
jgi:hypothetical protein